MKRTSNWRSSLTLAIIGAILATGINILIKIQTSFDFVEAIPSILASTVVGAILGWMFDLALGIQAILNDALSQLDKSSRALSYQENALNMLLKDKRHNNALHALITDSVREKFHHIPLVDINAYHNYLALAIEQSDRFEGVQNRTIGWYKDKEQGQYLREVSRKKMNLKTRIFIIEDKDKDLMITELKDKQKMEYYWNNTGREVRSFWILHEDFKNTYPDLAGIATDFGLYDNQLLIRYDDDHQVVTFHVIDNGWNEKRLFDKLETQINNGFTGPFVEIDPADLANLHAPPTPSTPSA